MKKNMLMYALCATLAVVAISCGRNDPSRPAVPKDASVVVHINAGALTKKLSWDEIKQTNWFRELYAKADDTLARKMMENPSNSGIDTEKDMVFFVKKQGRGAYLVFEGAIKDAGAFEKFNVQMNEGAGSAKSGDLSVMTLKNDGVLSYNDKKFVYVINAPGLGNRGMPGGNTLQEYRFPADSLQMFGAVLYDLPSDESMYDDDRFAATMKESGDLHIWSNNEQSFGNMASSMLGMMKVNALFENNATGMAVNFDDGKISMKTRQFFSKEVLKLLEKYPAKDISTDIVNRIPSQNVAAAIVMNYPPEGLKELLKLVGFDGAVNGYLQQLGFSMDEFVKANKGDMLIAITDLQIGKDSMIAAPGADGEPSMKNAGGNDMKYLFATSINDRPAFDKMMGAMAAQLGNVVKDGKFPSLNYKLDNNWFVAGNSEQQVSQFLAGNTFKQPFASRIGGHAFGAFIDLNKIMSSTSFADRDTTAGKAMTASIRMWQDILVTGGKVKDDALNYDVEINLVNKSTNSLKQLNAYFDELSLYNKKTVNF